MHKKSKIIVYCLLLLTFCNPGRAQTPNVIWGKPHFATTSIRQTSDHDFIMTSGSSLIKTDSAGNILWTQEFEGVLNEFQLLPEGGTIIVGTEDKKLLAVKTDEQGDTLWTKLLGRTTAEFGNAVTTGYSVDYLYDGGFVFSGTIIETFLGNPGKAILYYVKTDSLGNALWEQEYTGSALEIPGGNSIRRMPDGGFLIGGGNTLIITDSEGIKTWSRYYTSSVEGHGSYSNTIEAVRNTLDSGFIVIGWSHDPEYFFNGNFAFNIWIHKSGNSGSWTKTFGEPGSRKDYAWDIQPTSDSGYIAVGNYYTDGWISKLNQSGEQNWELKFGRNITCVWPTLDSGYIIVEDTSLTKIGFGPPLNIHQNPGYPLNSPALHAFPNPFNQNITLTFPNPYRKADIFIYNVWGQEVKRFSNLKSKHISWVANRLSAGVYRVRVVSNHKIYHKTITLVK